MKNLWRQVVFSGFSLFLITAIALLDAWVGKEITLWGLYLLPVSITAWKLGASQGVCLAILASMLSWGVGCHFGNPFSDEAYFLLATLWRTSSMILVAWLVGRLRTKEITRIHIGNGL